MSALKQMRQMIEGLMGTCSNGNVQNETVFPYMINTYFVLIYFSDGLLVFLICTRGAINEHNKNDLVYLLEFKHIAI